MTLIRKNSVAVLLIFILLNGCSLKQMIKMSKDQKLTVTPSPIELHGDSVKFEMSALLPAKMLKKKKVYTVNTSYKYSDQKINLGDIQFKAADFPNAASQQPQISKKFSFAYKPEIINGDVVVIGSASNEAITKSKTTPEMSVAKGIITTSRLVKDPSYVAFAEHGYNNQPEFTATTVEFYFEQGKSKLRTSESKGTRGKFLDAFLAKKNVTKYVNIVGQHSPEGPEMVNARLSEERASVIEKYYKGRMKFFNYKKQADSIGFVTKGVVQDWAPLKAELDKNTTLSDQEKTEIRQIVNGSGSFEDKQGQIEKLPYYSKILMDVYPQLRVARTEILSPKKKKTDAEISLLAQGISDGKISADTLNDAELSYAATLTPIMTEKEKIYLAATKKNDSWASHNNLGAVYLDMAMKSGDPAQKQKYADMAINQFQISYKAKDNAESHSNLAYAYMIKGNKVQAMEEANIAIKMQSTDELKKGSNGLLGSLLIREGKYDEAIQALSKGNDSPEVTYNLALAYLLKKDLASAKSGFESATSAAPNDAWAYYGSAITGARMKDEAAMATNLRKAAQLDKKLVNRAIEDLEFMSYWNSDSFKNALK